MVYQTENVIKEQGDKLDASERESVETALAKVREALAGTDVEAIKAATETLMTASQSFSQKLYEAASAEQAQSAPTGDAGINDDEVVDAEIVDEA